MSIIAGRDVKKVSQTKAEILPNSAAAAAATVDARIQAAAPDAFGPRLRFDRYVLDPARGCVMAGDEEIGLRPKTFALLCHLVANPGRLVPKDELVAAVWPNLFVSDDSLVQCVTELRRALQDDGQRLIRTVPRRGYRFEAAVTAEAPAATQPAPPFSEDDASPVPDVPSAKSRTSRCTFLALGCIAALAAAIGAGWWWIGSRLSAPTAPPLSVAVLPFDSVGDDPAQSYIAEGLTSDLTTELSRVPGTFVIAHATALTFKGKEVDARQLGHALNVRYLLTGNVHRAGDQIRINAQLIDAASGANVWAERFERRRDRYPEWQDEILGRIASALNFRLTRLESDRAIRERHHDPEAFDLTTRGWALVYAAKRPENYHSARDLFRQALALDAAAVNALVGIGWTSAVIILDGWSASPAQDLALAEDAVAKALAIEPNHVVAHHVRGFTFRLRGRSSAAHDSFRTAIALNPNFAPGHAQLGATALELGRPEQTVAAIEAAMRLSPRDPSLGPWLAIAGIAELHLGRDKQAAAWLSRAVDTGTPVALHQAYLARALALSGQLEQARAALADFRRAKPSATITALRAQARSRESAYIAQRERLYERLRIAGLPE